MDETVRPPPMSELFEAMARGVVAPYHQHGAMWSGNAYDIAKQQAGIYSAIAAVYRKYEEAAKK